MRVNSAFKGLFGNRLVIGITIAMVLSISNAFASSSETLPGRDRELRAKQVNLLIRLIGHRLLTQSGDFTSRILPVTETADGTFLLQFENQFVFSHDSLIMMSQDLFPKAQYPSGYTVTVLDCMKADIVYGFQVNNGSSDLLACRGRSEQAGCYVIEFAFPDFYRNVKADLEQPAEELKSINVDRQKSDAKLEILKTSTTNIDKLTAELRSFKAEPLKANSKRQALEKTSSAFSLVNLIPGGLLVLLGVTLLVGRFGKAVKPVGVQVQNAAVLQESVHVFASLGKFKFDVKGQRLLLGSEVISLTDKECQILELLNQSFGELIPRDTLMQKIWINEGVITGRSLDMFVSKLRKKLSGDAELRITNVHGKGYKLEII